MSAHVVCDKVSSEIEERIWKNGGYRVFFSHVSGFKEEVAELKEKMDRFGTSCFVAHEDITPTSEWCDEIGNALSTMDCLVALVTDDFHESEWTDQEVGIAYGRQVPVYPVKLEEKVPSGFLSNYQAIRCGWDDASEKIFPFLLQETAMLDAFIGRIEHSNSYDESNAFFQKLLSVKKINSNQGKKLMDIFNKNSQVKESFSFSGEKGELGLVSYLNGSCSDKFRWTNTLHERIVATEK